MRRLILSLGVTLFATASASAAPVYVNFANGGLATVNTTTGAATTIGNTGVALGDIALSTGGGLFGFGISDNTFYSINTATAAATPLGTSGAFTNALAFRADGTLFAAGGTTLYTVNTANGALTTVGTFSGVGNSGGDLVFTADGKLYVSTDGGRLAQLNPATGAVITSVPFSPASSSVFGLAADGGTLFAFSNTVGGIASLTSNTYALNPTTGALTLVGSTGIGTVNGAAAAPAAAPVPEPATLAAFGALAAVGFGYTRRRLKAAPVA